MKDKSSKFTFLDKKIILVSMATIHDVKLCIYAFYNNGNYISENR